MNSQTNEDAPRPELDRLKRRDRLFKEKNRKNFQTQGPGKATAFAQTGVRGKGSGGVTAYALFRKKRTSALLLDRC